MIVKTAKGYYTKSTQGTHTCICNRYKAKKLGFMNGQKKCSKCEIFMVYEGIFCPCCGLRLRTTSRSYPKKDVERI